MDWATPLSTLIGAAIGISATLLVESVRWQRTRAQGWEQTRRELYAEFLAGAMEAHGALRAAAYPPSNAQSHTSTDPHVAVQEAFRTSGIYEKRHRLGLVAPKSVVSAADIVFYMLVDIRKILSDGHHVETDEYREHVAPLSNAIYHMRDVMRIDLGVEPLRTKSRPAPQK